jgi:hypothetical protein
MGRFSYCRNRCQCAAPSGDRELVVPSRSNATNTLTPILCSWRTSGVLLFRVILLAESACVYSGVPSLTITPAPRTLHRCERHSSSRRDVYYAAILSALLTLGLKLLEDKRGRWQERKSECWHQNLADTRSFLTPELYW